MISKNEPSSSHPVSTHSLGLSSSPSTETKEVSKKVQEEARHTEEITGQHPSLHPQRPQEPPIIELSIEVVATHSLPPTEESFKWGRIIANFTEKLANRFEIFKKKVTALVSQYILKDLNEEKKSPPSTPTQKTCQALKALLSTPPIAISRSQLNERGQKFFEGLKDEWDRIEQHLKEAESNPNTNIRTLLNTLKSESEWLSKQLKILERAKSAPTHLLKDGNFQDVAGAWLEKLTQLKTSLDNHIYAYQVLESQDTQVLEPMPKLVISSVDRPLEEPKTSFQHYNELMDGIVEKGESFKLTRTKGESKIIQVAVTDYKDILAVSKTSKTAFKEVMQAAIGEMQRDPIASLQLLDKMQSTIWGQQVLRFSPHLKERFYKAYQEGLELGIKSDPLASLDLINKMQSTTWGQRILRFNPHVRAKLKEAYQNGLEQCVRQSGAEFASLLSQVTREELLKSGGAVGKPSYENVCPHLDEISRRFNAECYSVMDKILSKKDFKERTRAMEMYIRMSHLAYESGDLATAQAIFAGLSKAAINRLAKSKNALSPQVKDMLESLDQRFGNLSLDKAPEDRKNMIANKNAYSLPLVPVIVTSFLGPLTFAAEKQDPIKAAIKELKWSNASIKKAEEGSLDTTIAQLQKFIDTLSQKVKSLNQKIESLPQDLQNLEEEKAKLKKESSSLTFKQKDAESALKQALKVQVLDEPGLRELEAKNSQDMKKYEKALQIKQDELTLILDQFETLVEPLKKYPSQVTLGKPWYELPKDKIDTDQKDREYMAISRQYEPKS